MSASADPSSPVAWVALTLDCADAASAAELAAFYAEALGGEVVSGSVRARGLLLVFEAIPDYRPPTWPSAQTPKQMHFEWMVDDLEAAVTRLQELGARMAEHQTGDSLRVMLDPAGHPFLRRDDGGRRRAVPGRGTTSAALTPSR